MILALILCIIITVGGLFKSIITRLAKLVEMLLSLKAKQLSQVGR